MFDCFTDRCEFSLAILTAFKVLHVLAKDGSALQIERIVFNSCQGAHVLQVIFRHSSLN